MRLVDEFGGVGLFYVILSSSHFKNISFVIPRCIYRHYVAAYSTYKK